MTTAVRDAAGRFIARPPLPVCQSCGRVLFENLAADLMCVWPCQLARQVVGNTGADVGVMGEYLKRPVPSESVQTPNESIRTPQRHTNDLVAIPAHPDATDHTTAHTDTTPTSPTAETTTEETL